MDNRYEIITVTVGELAVNCYIVGNPKTHECVIIDPGDEPERIDASLGGYQPKAVLLTHGHFDHVGACDAVCEKYGIPAYIHQLDEGLLHDPVGNVSLQFEMPAVSLSIKPKTFQGGETLTLAGIPFTTLHTPGHTPGGACFFLPDNAGVFCGDTLFLGGYGRTDMQGGDFRQLRESLRVLMMQIPKMPAYPGHGGQTTAGR